MLAGDYVISGAVRELKKLCMDQINAYLQRDAASSLTNPMDVELAEEDEPDIEEDDIQKMASSVSASSSKRQKVKE
jgi:hypothetical protein